MGRQHDTKPPLEKSHDLGKDGVGGGCCLCSILYNPGPEASPKCWFAAFEIHQAGREKVVIPLFKVWLSGGKNPALCIMNTCGDGQGIATVKCTESNCLDSK